MHPANPGSQARARDHLRAAPADHVEVEQIRDGRKHLPTCKTTDGKSCKVLVPFRLLKREDWEPCLSFSPATARSFPTGSGSTTTSRSRSSAARAAGSPTPR